jgi:hypothetical protein
MVKLSTCTSEHYMSTDEQYIRFLRWASKFMATGSLGQWLSFDFTCTCSSNFASPNKKDCQLLVCSDLGCTAKLVNNVESWH